MVLCREGRDVTAIPKGRRTAPDDGRPFRRLPPHSRQGEGVEINKGTDSGAAGRAAGASYWTGSGRGRRKIRATKQVAMSFSEMRTLPKVPFVCVGGGSKAPPS